MTETEYGHKYSRASLFGEATQCLLGVETDKQTLWISFISLGPDSWCLFSLCWHLKYLIPKCYYSHGVCCFFGTFYSQIMYISTREGFQSIHLPKPENRAAYTKDCWHIKAASMEDMDNTISFVSHFIIVLDYTRFSCLLRDQDHS